MMHTSLATKLALDLSLLLCSYWLSLQIRFDFSVPGRLLDEAFLFAPLLSTGQATVLWISGSYRSAWRYASVGDAVRIATASAVVPLPLAFAAAYLPIPFSRGVLASHAVFSAVLLLSARLAYRAKMQVAAHRRLAGVPVARRRVLIVGAGEMGEIIARSARSMASQGWQLVGFVDDAPSLQGHSIHNRPVLGSISSLPEVLKRQTIDEVLVALPEPDGETLGEILGYCAGSTARLTRVPGIGEIVEGASALSQTREIRLEDLLQRRPVELDDAPVRDFIRGKRVLVTGAGGSIGREMCRQIAAMAPEALIMLGRGENSIFEAVAEVSELGFVEPVPVIASVQDHAALRKVFTRHRPDIVFHAAAHKHVPLMEIHLIEAIRNNVFGTRNLVQLSHEFGLDAFVLISSDKAVNPLCVMGASKRIAEMIVQSKARQSRTKYTAVRFGNVLGSRGSVVPTMQRQIARGGPVTVTHPEMTRYFMTIPEAVRLVLQSAAIGATEEIFVLDMGLPMKIMDLARNLIRLSGKIPDREIEIKITGVRPGEKLHEELLTRSEGAVGTDHCRIFAIRNGEEQFSEGELNQGLRDLEEALKAGREDRIRPILSSILPSMREAGEPSGNGASLLPAKPSDGRENGRGKTKDQNGGGISAGNTIGAVPFSTRNTGRPVDSMGARKRIYLSSPHMGPFEQSFVKEAFDSNWLSSVGPNIDAFEQEVADYAGMAGGVALSSATAAIHLALLYLGAGPGETVFCSSLTFVASANPIRYLNAEPVFIDSEPESWNMSPGALERAFRDAERRGRLPRAVVIVNLFGQSADMDPLLEICDRRGVPVVEDAAESLGATYRGKASGSFGKFGIYSFNGNKIITTTGGGMIVSDDREAMAKIRFWATQARDQAPHYEHSETGYNYRLSNVLAGIGRGQIRMLDQWVRLRRRVFSRYTELLGDLPGFEFMPEMPRGTSTRWLTALTVDEERNGVTSPAIIAALARENIESRPVWKPMHLQPLYQGRRYYSHEEGVDRSEALFRKGLCLPSGSNLTDGDIERVATAVRACVAMGAGDSVHAGRPGRR